MSEIDGYEEKEITISLNTNDGQVSFKTDKLKGKLDALIIESLEKVSVIIESEIGYLIFKRNELHGIYYFSIRNKTTSPEESMFDYPEFDEFLLNESLIITVIGAKNIETRITFRFS